MERERTVPIGDGLNNVMAAVHLVCILVITVLLINLIGFSNWKAGLWCMFFFGIWFMLSFKSILDVSASSREYIMRIRNEKLVAVHTSGYVFLIPFIERGMRVKNPMRSFSSAVRVNVIGEDNHATVAARGAEVLLPYTIFGFLRPEFAASVLEIGVDENAEGDTSKIDEGQLKAIIIPLTDARVRAYGSKLTLDQLNETKGMRLSIGTVLNGDADTTMPEGFELTHILFGDPQESEVVIQARDGAQAALARRETEQTENTIAEEKMAAVSKMVAQILAANPGLDSNLVYATVARARGVDVEELKRYDINVTGLQALSHVQIAPEVLGQRGGAPIQKQKGSKK